MLRACAEAAEASSEASRSSGVSGMLPHSTSLRAEDSAQPCPELVEGMTICGLIRKGQLLLFEPCPKMSRNEFASAGQVELCTFAPKEPPGF